MEYTRKQYMDYEVSHQEYYAQFVTESTRRYVFSEFSAEELKQAFAEDEHLNNLKIPFNNHGSGGNWWWDYTPIDTSSFEEIGECDNCATRTCVGKAMAKIMVDEIKQA